MIVSLRWESVLGSCRFLVTGLYFKSHGHHRPSGVVARAIGPTRVAKRKLTEGVRAEDKHVVPKGKKRKKSTSPPTPPCPVSPAALPRIVTQSMPNLSTTPPLSVSPTSILSDQFSPSSPQSQAGSLSLLQEEVDDVEVSSSSGKDPTLSDMLFDSLSPSPFDSRGSPSPFSFTNADPFGFASRRNGSGIDTNGRNSPALFEPHFDSGSFFDEAQPSPPAFPLAPLPFPVDPATGF